MALLLDFQRFTEWHFKLIVERRSQWAAAQCKHCTEASEMMRLEMDDYSKRNATATYNQICHGKVQSSAYALTGVGLRRHP